MYYCYYYYFIPVRILSYVHFQTKIVKLYRIFLNTRHCKLDSVKKQMLYFNKNITLSTLHSTIYLCQLEIWVKQITDVINTFHNELYEHQTIKYGVSSLLGNQGKKRISSRWKGRIPYFQMHSHIITELQNNS